MKKFLLPLLTLSVSLIIGPHGLAQTSYTWNGSTSSAWGTSANWTPNGVPGSSDDVSVNGGTYALALTSDRAVYDLTVNGSGTVLGLGGNRLTVTGRMRLLGGTVENGRLVMESPTESNMIQNMDMDCIVEIDGRISTMSTNSFTDSLIIRTPLGSSSSGNVFHAPCDMLFEGNGSSNFGITAPDTFLAPVKFRVEGATHYLSISWTALGTYFADTVFLEHFGASAGNTLVIGNHPSTSSVRFDGPIVVSAGEGNARIHFKNNVTHAGPVLIGPEGFGASRLQFSDYTQTSSIPMVLDDMDADGTVILGQNLELLGDITAKVPKAQIESGTTFRGRVELERINSFQSALTFDKVADLGFIATSTTGGNLFKDTVFLSTGATLTFGSASPDTFLAPVTASITGACNMVMAASAGNYFADRVTLNNYSGDPTKGFSFCNSSSYGARFEEDIELNVPDGGGAVNFNQGQVVHNGLIVIGEEGFHDGTLTLYNYTQIIPGEFDLNGMDTCSMAMIRDGSDIVADLHCASGAQVSIWNSTLRGDVHLEVPSVYLRVNRFLGELYAEKTGEGYDNNSGNAYHGSATIVNNSSATGSDARIDMGNTTYPDSVFSDLTLVNNSVGLFYHTSDFYKGNLTLMGDSAADFVLSYSSNDTLLFNGTENQTFSIAPDLDVDLYDMRVNKPSGTLTVAGSADLGRKLILTDGIMNTTAAELRMSDNAVVTGTSDSSYVEGPITKIGNEAFIFPVGRNGAYRPISISAPTSTVAEFRGEYFEGNSDWTWSHTDKEGTLNDIGRNEYWKLDRLNTTNTVSVTLTWDSLTSCAFDTLANLRVTAYDTTGGEWIDLGNGGTTGDTLAGTVVTDGTSGVFGVYGLGNTNPFVCASRVSDKPKEVVCDSIGDPLFMKRILIVGFNPSQVRQEAVDDLRIISADLDVFLKQPLLDTLSTVLTSNLSQYRLIRIFKRLTTQDTVSISRLSEEIRIPKFWSVFGLILPEGDTIASVLEKISDAGSFVQYAHLNWVSELMCDLSQDVSEFIPSDQLFSSQLSLDPSGLYDPIFEPLVGINVLGAWQHEFGRENVRVGVFDKGLVNNHPDFLFDGSSIVKGGWNFGTNSSLYPIPFNELGTHKHGTQIGGIIGAVRNNGTGIAGIAGGDQDGDQQGVALYGLKIIPSLEAEAYLSTDLIETVDAIVTSSLDMGSTDKDYAYAIHIGNHSWGIRHRPDVPEQLNPDAFQLLKDAYHVVNRNQVSSVAGRGNRGHQDPSQLLFPACFQDDWVISVGGTGSDGAYANEANGVSDSDEWLPNIGNGIDLAAPALSNMIKTLAEVYATNYGYTSLGKTSAATAHVSGVAALLLSKHNHPTAHPDNLSPEDVEWLLEKTATDAMLSEETQEGLPPELVTAINTHGYDDYIGWGRVDAGAAMALLVGPEFELRHYVNPSGFESSLEQTEVSIVITESSTIYEDNLGNPFAAGNYVADVYRVYAPFTVPLSATQVIYDINAENHPGYWPRHSASNLFGSLEEVGDDMVINLREDVSISLTGPSLVTGYTYRIYDPDTEEFLGWLPVDPEQARLAFSVLVHDLQYLECGTGISGEQVITQNTTWDTEMFPCGDVTVTSGSHLIVKGAVYFDPEAKLTVEQGAKLTVDGGVLTISCTDQNWQGIRVLGDPTASQGSVNVENPASSTTTQGLLVMKNGALLEHAKIGVVLGECDPCVTQTGGIIWAEDATFRNNRKDVAFMPYTKGSNSRFENCTFLTDAPMNSPEYNGKGNDAHVTVWAMNGVRFTDCKFVCDIDDSWDGDGQYHNFDVDERGKGIMTNDSRVVVQKSTSGPGCSFRNLSLAFLHRRYTQSPIRYADVSNATFNNCMRGVALEGCSHDRIRNSTFNIPSTVGWYWAWGFYSTDSRTYTLGDNSFAGLNGPSTTAWGSLTGGGQWTTESPGLSGSGGIMRANIFNDLVIGTQTQQWNPYLKLRCNEYTDTEYAWAINPGSSEDPQGYGGYLGPQGTGCLPITQYRAGNLFHDTGTDHIWSWAYPEKYYAAGGVNANTLPNISTGGPYLNLENCDFGDSDDSCESGTITTFEEGKSKKAALDVELAALKVEYNTALTYVDSGNTATLLTHLADTTYTTATLTSELLGSGLLSDTVLKAACQRQPFFHENDFTTIIINNSPVSYPVWTDVVEHSFSKLKQSIKDSITDAQATDTLRTLEILRRETMAARSDHFEVTNAIIGLYVDADSIPALIHYMIDSLSTKEYRRLAVGTALDFDTVTWARTILDNLDLENENDSVFYEFNDLAVSLAEDTLTWLDLDSTQLVRMWELAESDFDVAIHAQAVLGLVLDTIFERVPEPLPEAISEKMDGNASESELEDEPTQSGMRTLMDIKVFPNPFQNSFQVFYNLEKESMDVLIEVFDLVGRSVQTKQILNSQSGTVNIDLGDCLGIYMMRMYSEGKQMHQQKIVCVQY